MAARKHKPKPRGASRTQSAPARKTVPGWIWLVGGVVLGGFVMFLAQLEPGRDEVKRAPTAQPESTAKAVAPAPPPRPKYEFYEELSKATPAPLPGEQLPAEQAAEAARVQALLEGRTPPPRPSTAQPAVTTSTPAAAPAGARPAAVQPPTPVQAPPPVPKPVPAQVQSPPPAAAPPPPATKPATEPAARYYLQAGSFGSRDQAESARAKLILLGQDARVESGQVGGKTWHRVVVGPFTSRPQADSAQKQLGANGVGSVVQQRR